MENYLTKFYQQSELLNSFLVIFIRKFINEIKMIYNLEDMDIVSLFQIDKEKYNDIMGSEDKDISIDSKLLSKIYYISNGNMSLQQIFKSIPIDIVEVSDYLNKIKQEKYADKVNELLELMSIKTEEDLNFYLDIFKNKNDNNFKEWINAE